MLMALEKGVNCHNPIVGPHGHLLTLMEQTVVSVKNVSAHRIVCYVADWYPPVDAARHSKCVPLLMQTPTNQPKTPSKLIEAGIEALAIPNIIHTARAPLCVESRPRRELKDCTAVSGWLIAS